MERLTSEIFGGVSHSYLHRLAMSWLAHRWAFFAFPLMAVAVWALHDHRAIYVGVMILFIIYPSALLYVWMKYAFSIHTIRAVMSKCISLTDRGVEIDYFHPHTGEEILHPQCVPWQDIVSVQRKASVIVLIIGDSVDQRIEIPVDAFDNDTWNIFFKSLPKHTDELDKF